jgi:hypothetical protein
MVYPLNVVSLQIWYTKLVPEVVRAGRALGCALAVGKGVPRGRRWLMMTVVALTLPAASAPAFSVGGPPAAPSRGRPAHPVPVAATTTAPSGFILGEGWGCASLRFRDETRWQCWDAGPHPTTWEVPWLTGRAAVAGRNRVCALDSQGASFHCWRRPIRGQPARELPETEWQGAGPAPNEDVYARQHRADRAGSATLGAGFACLQARGGVFCVGDDRFGQRGGSAPPGPDARARDPAFVRGTSPADSVVAGTWHACALAVPSGYRSAYAACWGRDDVGQLGAPATSTCAADGREVPCSRQPVRGPAVGTDDGLGMLAAGDLFTCLATSAELRCWGASRDGFFGAPQACPDLLRRAWPTAAGPVAAPRAACAQAPVVLAEWSGGSSYPSSMAAGPRGLCVAERGAAGVWCRGAIPTPRAEGIGGPTPSPGDDAAACAMSGDRVVCWGQGYAGAGPLDQPVSVTFATAVPAGQAAQFDLPRDDHDQSQVGLLPCQRVVAPLPACSPQIASGARAWSDVLADAPTRVGRTIGVRGALDVSEYRNMMTSNPPWVSAPLVLGGAPPLFLGDHSCGAYGTRRICCDLPAYGQTVVATGRLEALPPGSLYSQESPWLLASPTLCEETPSPR